MKFAKTLAVAAIATLAATAANASITVQGASFGTGSTYNSPIGTFSAVGGTGNFGQKTQGGYTGTGVQGGAAGAEIDIGEAIVGNFGSVGVGFSQIVLGLLFNGPEYGDTNEVAKIGVTYADNTTDSFTFTATGNTSAIWSGAGTWANLSPAINGKGGVWAINNPFVTKLVKSLTFTAVAGACVETATCTSQSDYTLVSVTAVPEVETSAMMLAGLGLMGAIVRRRKQA